MAGLEGAAPGLRAMFEVGPLRVDVEAAPPWDRAWSDLVDGFDAARPASDARLATPHGAVGLSVALTSAPASPGAARTPCFAMEPAAALDGAALTDRCEAWEARIERPRGPSIAARFRLWDGRPEAHVRRELVASALRSALALAAPAAGALLVHGAALASDGGAVVFVGPSGEGKSTMARRLAGWTLLADDATLVTPATASGTPLRGKEGLPRRGGACPLRALVVLEKGAPALRLERLSPAAATAALLPRVFWYARAPALEATLLDVVAQVVERVPTYRLASSLADDVAPALAALAAREAA